MMNLAFFAEPRTWAPLQGLLRWLVPAVTPLHRNTPALPADRPASRLHTTTPCARPRPETATTCLTQRRPLRVVRILEADQPPSQVGRMVISGRFADVCAELDRLAACENASR